MAMQKTILDRGPDGCAIWTSPDGRAGLGINRLAIVDPEHGQQPFFAGRDGRYATVANGVIYNQHDLRNELDPETMHTHCDIEVIPALAAARGDRFVEHLAGMFGLALYDAGRETITLARDRTGIKPLYFVAKGDRTGGRDPHAAEIVFASEAKALAAVGADTSRIRSLPPGCKLTPTGEHRWHRWTAPSVPTPADPELLRTVLDAAVRRHLMSDVPVALFLSGGVDSSAVAALATRHRPDMPAFTVGIPGSSDVAAARLVAKHLGIKDHIIVPLDLDEIMDSLSTAVYVSEHWNPMRVVEGMVTGALAKAVHAAGIKVVLCGEGSDEIFLGYETDRATPPQHISAVQLRNLALIAEDENQRLDRWTMRHSVEARVPFQDPHVINHVLGLPPWAILRPGAEGVTISKWILRKAFEPLLPPGVAWRRKTSIDAGVGVDQVYAWIGAAHSPDLLTEYAASYPHAKIETTTAMELHTHFVAHFGEMGGPNVYELFGRPPSAALGRAGMDGAGT
jgi:asparagine synthase (glutamine-hydrolysing)